MKHTERFLSLEEEARKMLRKGDEKAGLGKRPSKSTLKKE